MKIADNTTTQQIELTNLNSELERSDLTEVFAPIIKPLSSPLFVGYFAILVLLAMLSMFTGRRGSLSDVRFANRAEIKRGRQRGLRQIAAQVPKEMALELDRGLVLSDLQPAMSVVGRSRAGKTRSFIDPAIKSGIDQGWSNIVFDVKGNLMKKHAAYALAKGYDVYVYAPGFDYSDGLNFLDFMKHPGDAKAAYELARVLENNFGEPGARKNDFFSSQGIALLKTVLMLAKESVHQDLFSAWKFLSLPDLASRLKLAKVGGRFNDLDINSWIGEAAVGLSAVSDAAPTSAGIVGNAITHFQNLVDPSIVPCLLKSTIPLDLTGKQIVFFQIDENSEAATAPLVAMAIHMLVKRNLNATVTRDRTLGVFLDEFSSIYLPDVESWINRNAEYGMFMMLGYQSNSQLKIRYTRDKADSILSACGTKVLFNTGHSETAEKFARSLGEKEVPYSTRSRSRGKNRSITETENTKKVPLVTGEEINRFGQGKCIIKNPGYDYRPRKLKVRIDKRNDRLWSRATQAWNQKILPLCQEEFSKFLDRSSLEVERINRETMAGSMLPSEAELAAMAS